MPRSNDSFQFSLATFFPSGLLWLGWPSCSPAVWMPHPLALCKLLGFLFRQVPRRAIHPGLQCSEAMSIQPARNLHLHFQSPIYIRIIPVWPGWGTPHIFGGGFLNNYRDWQSHSPGPHSRSQGFFVLIFWLLLLWLQLPQLYCTTLAALTIK